MQLFRALTLGAAALFTAAATASAQVPKASDGHPDLSGIWQAMGTANWDLEDHGPEPGPFYQLGAIGAIPPGRGVVEGGDIPYKPEALAKRKENRGKRWTNDPEVKCYMPGIPRAAYLPQPFQIVQSSSVVLMAYQYASTNRVINMGKPKEAAVDTWMGTANGKWEGETLVIDNTGFNDQSWFDRSGNYHSDVLHVVERYTRSDRDHIRYEATIEDPKIFTRPWKIALTLYRDVDPGATLGEFKCVEFSERMLYSDLSVVPEHLPKPRSKGDGMRLLTVICLAGVALAQTKAPDAKWQPPKTAWGAPDLQGTYTSDDLQGVPMERPAQYGTRRFLTDQEVAEREASVDRQKSAIDTGERPKEGFWARVQGLGKVEAEAVPPNFVEYARRASTLTSLVSDPPDGRIPATTEQSRQRRAASYTNTRPQSYLDMTIYDRCITRGVTAGFFPAIYGNGSQFIQTPDTVAIRYEMIHETRLIPLDNRPRDKIRSYMGEPRGHWEGNTLVVETTNFIGGKLSISGPPYSEDLVLTERFTRVAPNVLEYSVTVNDPKTWIAPWTATFPLTSEPGYEIFEYACHEGNYAMRNRLSAARALEAKDAKDAAAKK